MEDYPNLETYKGRADHVIVDGKSGGMFRCLHCGASRDPQFPVDMKKLIRLIDDFIGMHAECKKGNGDGQAQ